MFGVFLFFFVFWGGGYIRNYTAIPCHVDTAAWLVQRNGKWPHTRQQKFQETWRLSPDVLSQT